MANTVWLVTGALDEELGNFEYGGADGAVALIEDVVDPNHITIIIDDGIDYGETGRIEVLIRKLLRAAQELAWSGSSA